MPDQPARLAHLDLGSMSLDRAFPRFVCERLCGDGTYRGLCPAGKAPGRYSRQLTTAAGARGHFIPRARGADFPPPRSPAAARLSLLVGWRTARFQGVNEGSTDGGEFRSVGPACQDGLGASSIGWPIPPTAPDKSGRLLRSVPHQIGVSAGPWSSYFFRGSSAGLK